MQSSLAGHVNSRFIDTPKVQQLVYVGLAIAGGLYDFN